MKSIWLLTFLSLAATANSQIPSPEPFGDIFQPIVDNISKPVPVDISGEPNANASAPMVATLYGYAANRAFGYYKPVSGTFVQTIGPLGAYLVGQGKATVDGANQIYYALVLQNGPPYNTYLYGIHTPTGANVLNLLIPTNAALDPDYGCVIEWNPSTQQVLIGGLYGTSGTTQYAVWTVNPATHVITLIYLTSVATIHPDDDMLSGYEPVYGLLWIQADLALDKFVRIKVSTGTYFDSISYPDYAFTTLKYDPIDKVFYAWAAKTSTGAIVLARTLLTVVEDQSCDGGRIVQHRLFHIVELPAQCLCCQCRRS